MSQTTRPSAALITIGSSVPIKPRSELAKSARSLKSAAMGMDICSSMVSLMQGGVALREVISD